MATERKSSQLPVFPATTRTELIAQTLYECSTKQDGWVKQAPIKFGGVKLTDAVDPGYLGIHGYDEKVLNYEGVGSSISCRLMVRPTFQTPPTYRFIFTSLPKFSGKEIKRRKAGPTN